MQTKFTRAAIGALSGAALFATAAPAIARDPVTKAANAHATTTATPGRAQRYCVDAVVTGSRIKRRTCMTASEWSHQGVDIAREAERNTRR